MILYKKKNIEENLFIIFEKSNLDEFKKLHIYIYKLYEKGIYSILSINDHIIRLIIPDDACS